MIITYVMGLFIATIVIGFIAGKFEPDEYDFPSLLRVGCVVLWPLALPILILIGVYIMTARIFNGGSKS